MIAKVTGVTPGGWWQLSAKPGGRHLVYFTLPTFLLPLDIRYTDRVHVTRNEGMVGFWRVTKVVRCVRSNPGRRAFRS